MGQASKALNGSFIKTNCTRYQISKCRKLEIRGKKVQRVFSKKADDNNYNNYYYNNKIIENNNFN